jgi:hypothetical protein
MALSRLATAVVDENVRMYVHPAESIPLRDPARLATYSNPAPTGSFRKRLSMRVRGSMPNHCQSRKYRLTAAVASGARSGAAMS